MKSEPRQSEIQQVREDEATSGFALSLVVAPLCILLGGWPILLLIPVVLLPVVWRLPWWRKRRPPRALITLGKVLAVAAATIWLVSLAMTVRWKVSNSEAWVFGGGQIEHIHYRGKPPIANDRDVSFELVSPTEFPGTLLMSMFGGGVSMGDGRRFTSRSVHWGTFAPLACVLMPTWLLHRLRKARIPPRCCVHCEYDLTGNVSGRCPECGEPFERREQEDNR